MKRNVITAVIIFAALGSGLFAQYAELDIAEIKRPFDVEEGGVGFKPKCVIHNNTSSTVNAKVTCRIKDLETFEKVYEDVLANFPCHGGNTTAEFIKEFVPESGKDYNAWFRVEAPQTGDTKDKNFTTEGYEVTPYEMIEPTTGYPPFSPEAMFAEMLGIQTPDVVLHCKIEDTMDSSFLAVIYEDSLEARTFEPDEEYDAVFATVEDVPHAYLITFWATDAEGNNISDPPLQEFIITNAVAEKPSAGFGLETIEIYPDFCCINFSLTHSTTCEMSVYDAAGTRITELYSGNMGAGEHSVSWNLEDVSQGVYFLRLKMPTFESVRKVMIIH
ncbi:T9SS type A sorting domain-containing protein [candidate division WOR-3 bacterium]|uniref:T9SS type A sorting domain-containing protein n=1 Tax=candidate division WOR-3 bacterium TaxID=2052148 RepID=A0A9D5QD91_UNCW3|nr:T9SS type A sorting domain-containing protein [candidate division WOR-3 bacterium]MBD3364811.1 T9SS type A sorting domain-containing protein [candidate division WOR-3 bacterium]